MSDTENLVDDVTTDVDTEIDTTDDVPDEKSKLLAKYGIEPDFSNIDEDTAIKFLKRIEKAEWLTVQQKKQLKELQSKSSESKDDVMTKAEYARMRFLEANPELNDYEKELGDYQKKGLSFEEAKVLILNSDKARQNREKLNSLGLSDWEPNSQKTTITKAELAKIAETNQTEYNRIRDLMDSGKMKVK